MKCWCGGEIGERGCENDPWVIAEPHIQAELQRAYRELMTTDEVPPAFKVPERRKPEVR